MSRPLLLVLTAAVALGGASAVSARPADDVTCTAVITGSVTRAREGRLPDLLSDHLDQVVVARLTVPAPSPADVEAGFSADRNEGRLLIGYSPGLGQGGWEVLAPAGGYRQQGSGWSIEGTFVVRSGGMHQGILSYALEAPSQPFPEACAVADSL